MESVDIFNILNILNIDTKGRTSGNIVVHCPTIGHNDSNPSCSISLDKGLYHCFSCGASGTLASLYKDLTGEYYNYLTELRPKYIRKIHNTTTTDLLSFDSIPTTHFHAELKGGSLSNYESGLEWLKQRGLTESVASKARIRFAEKITITDTDDNERRPMILNNCIYIPIFEGGQLISFEARPTVVSDKKVLYPYASSTNTLYNLNNLDINSPLFVTEGIIDCLSLWTNETTQNATAIFKNTPTERQFYLLNKFKKIIYVVDNDERGMEGCKKMMDRLGNKVSYLKPPKTVKDINDILQGKDQRFNTIQQLIDMKWLDKIC
jgi:DNA primase